MRRTVDPATLFLATTAVMAAGTSAKWIVLGVRLVEDLRLEPHELALLGTALELSVLVGEIPTGVIADVVSRRLSIVLSFLIMGPAMALSGIFEPFWMIALTQMGWGIGWTLQSGADVAWLTDELQDPERVDRLLITRAKVGLAARAAGVPVAFALAGLTTRSTAIVVASLSVAVWGVVLALIMPEHGFDRAPGSTGAEFRRVLALGGRLAIRTPSLRILALATLLGGVASEAIDRLNIARLVEVGIPDDIDAVILSGALALMQAAVGISLVRLVERRLLGLGAARILGGLTMVAAATVAVAAGANALIVVFVALVMQEGMRAGADPFVTILANTHTESSARATVLSFMSQAHASGEILGGITLGALATATSLSTAFAVAAVIFALSGLIALRVRPAEATAPVA